LATTKQAALEFIDKQKDTNQVGMVAFAEIDPLDRGAMAPRLARYVAT
jgi:hypothetical protein